MTNVTWLQTLSTGTRGITGQLVTWKVGDTSEAWFASELARKAGEDPTSGTSESVLSRRPGVPLRQEDLPLMPPHVVDLR
jgi:hypothetical protein